MGIANGQRSSTRHAPEKPPNSRASRLKLFQDPTGGGSAKKRRIYGAWLTMTALNHVPFVSVNVLIGTLNLGEQFLRFFPVRAPGQTGIPGSQGRGAHHVSQLELCGNPPCLRFGGFEDEGRELDDMGLNLAMRRGSKRPHGNIHRGLRLGAKQEPASSRREEEHQQRRPPLKEAPVFTITAQLAPSP
jgi:hypothetical protein